MMPKELIQVKYIDYSLLPTDDIQAEDLQLALKVEHQTYQQRQESKQHFYEELLNIGVISNEEE